MFLLPIGHEHQTVQRLPWVTFCLIAACIAAYIYTAFGAAIDPQEVEDKITEYFEYLEQRPYLKISPAMEEYLSPKDREILTGLREGVDRSSISNELIKLEQQTLD